MRIKFRSATMIIAAAAASLDCVNVFAQNSVPQQPSGELDQATPQDAVLGATSSAPSPSDIASAAARAAAARELFAQAQSDLNLTTIRLRQEFLDSGDYRSAMNEQDSAQAAYDAVRKTVSDSLSSDQAYQDLVSRRDRVAEVLEADKATLLPVDRLQLSERKMEYASEASRWETDSMARNPDVAAARLRLASASARLAELRQKFEDSIHLDPAWQAAKAAIVQTRIASSAADAYLAGAIQSRNDAINAEIARTAYVNSYPYFVSQTADNDGVYGPYPAVYGPYPVGLHRFRY